MNQLTRHIAKNVENQGENRGETQDQHSVQSPSIQRNRLLERYIARLERESSVPPTLFNQKTPGDEARVFSLLSERF